MNTLDDLLTGAAQRLDDATATTPVPSMPRPSLPIGRLAAAAVCVLAVVGGIVAIRARDRHTQRPVTYPPGLLDGANGPEITLTEVPDGDDDPATWKLQATPDGGIVERTRQDVAPATTAAYAVPLATVAGSVPSAAGATVPSTESPDATADTVPTGLAAPGAQSAYCLTTASAGGLCPDGVTSPEMMLGARGGDGQALVYGLPATTFAVTFQSGGVRSWERPLHGVALFPFPATAATTATYSAIDADGRLLAVDSSSNETMTDEEVAAAVVTTTTDETLPGSWFVEPPDNAGLGAQVIRLAGRTSLVGFRGPFTEQGYVLDQLSGSPRWIDVVTVRTADAAAVEQRLAAAPHGSIRSTSEVEPGVTVLLWADDTVPASEIDRALATLREREPRGDLAIDLDTPFAFDGSRAHNFSGASPSLQALMTDVVGTVDGHEIVATSDDVGNVQFQVEIAPGNRFGVRVGPHVAGPKRVPDVGSSMFQWLWAVPSDVTAVRLTLDDGTVVTPRVVDVTALADAKLLFVAESYGDHRVAAVDVTHG